MSSVDEFNNKIDNIYNMKGGNIDTSEVETKLNNILKKVSDNSGDYQKTKKLMDNFSTKFNGKTYNITDSISSDELVSAYEEHKTTLSSGLNVQINKLKDTIKNIANSLINDSVTETTNLEELNTELFEKKIKEIEAKINLVKEINLDENIEQLSKTADSLSGGNLETMEKNLDTFEKNKRQLLKRLSDLNVRLNKIKTTYVNVTSSKTNMTKLVELRSEISRFNQNNKGSIKKLTDIRNELVGHKQKYDEYNQFLTENELSTLTQGIEKLETLIKDTENAMGMNQTATQEEATRKAAEEEAARKAAQEEAARKAAQEEAARKAAKEEAARKAAKEEAVRKAAQEEAARKAAQEEAARKAAQEEAARKAAQEEAARKAAQEEAVRKAAQEEAARKAAEEEALKIVLDSRTEKMIKNANRGRPSDITKLGDFVKRKDVNILEEMLKQVTNPSGKDVIQTQINLLKSSSRETKKYNFRFVDI